LGGWNNTVWLDFDVKQFASESDCTQAVTKIIENPALATPSKSAPTQAVGALVSELNKNPALPTLL
jgi:hypothetical protein